MQTVKGLCVKSAKFIPVTLVAQCDRPQAKSKVCVRVSKAPPRLCTKSRRAKVRQGKNRRGTAGVAFDSTCCK
ncbi:hypothetical protein DND58_06430 [Pseudomonas syringae pv. pisi]|nr:hypothetical protein [Pseudomonas syringae]POP73932.1 hypothetical protein CXB37_21480 [Pseudomonas syringae pv. syringae]PYD18200.1 hypothetical protein DND62_02165 [Pseudomonas syringae pv. pisi]PYD32994.1 hypothetical protein DND58_06430 [Pseudomonas syringae pv. pisi]PYD35178.1 hypothetical protein DND67_04320 [Pseudomonas syringae pv. pisi]